MTTMQEEWARYKGVCYPRGVSQIQEQECYQAYWAGALTALDQVMAASRLPEKEAGEAIEKLMREVVAVCGLEVKRILSKTKTN